MWLYIAKRVISYLPVLLALSFAVFALARLVPGDVVDILLSNVQTPEHAAQLRRLFGLDDPLLVQYASWSADALRGDLGSSLFSGRPVTTEILLALGPTLELALSATAVAVLIGVPLGILAATRHNSWVDMVASSTSYIGVAMPVFWSGTLLILVFGVWLGVLPAGGYVALKEDLWAGVRTLVLPAFALGLNFAALLTRITRSSMLEVLRQEFISTARAKGLSERVVIYKHALRNSMITILTVLGLQIGLLLGGSVVIEAVFVRPGLGRLLLLAVMRRDYPLLQGVALFIAVAFMTINLLIDVLYAATDPRVSLN